MTQVVTATTQALDAAPLDVRSDRVSERFRRLIPRDFARQHLVISQGGSEDGRELLAVNPSSDRWAIHNVSVRLKTPVAAMSAPGERIAAVIDEAYLEHRSSDPADGESGVEVAGTVIATEIDQLLAQSDRDLLATQGKGPVVRLVDALIFEALQRGASDIHIQPLSDRTLIRYRLDGVLHVCREVPSAATTPIVSRIKVMGRMDIAERRIPQDGRATVTLGAAGTASEKSSQAEASGRAVDLRISTLPTSYGERVVIRLLDVRRQLAAFDQLGMPQDLAKRYLACARRSHGIILVTGPTGSGKTTTLYATLREVGSMATNIMTIEDPIEYDLSTIGLAVSQAQVNLKKGVSFATGLRHILRQDPDVVMIGEIRDAETARIAIQSSLTGHLVFSTLHTNDACSAVTRLIDLGVEPYLVAASLSAVLAQRLVRTVHAPCGGEGCDACGRTGYKGRCGIFELLVISEALRELVAHGAPLDAIRSAARSGGLRTLRDEGQRLIHEGVTTALEVERVVQGVGEEIEP